MYLIPIIALVLLAVIAVAWSPVFAVILAAILFLLFLGYVGMSRSSDEKPGTPEARAAARGRREEAETRIR